MLPVARAGGVVLLLAVACDGGSPATGEPVGAGEGDGGTAIPGALLAGTWPLLMADDAARAPFEGRRGWAALVMQRDYPGALADFSADPALPVGQARAHLEFAAAYRQAALVAAQAAVQVWDAERRDEDPPQVACIVGLAHLLLADDEAGLAALQACAASAEGPLAEHAAAWAAWRQAGGAWPPVEPLAGTPGLPTGGAVVGGLPDGGALPQFRFRDLVEGLEIQAASPMTLLGLALHHEAAAKLALPGAEAAVDAALAPWRLPCEPRGSIPQGTLPVEFLFGTPLLVSDDAFFLADLVRGQGLPAVAAWTGRSALASAIAPCIGAGGAAGPDVSCAVERANAAFEQVRGALEIRSGGEQGYHRPFAELGRLGVVRAAEWAAAAAGDERAMGLLRLNGIDLSVASAAEPPYLLSIAAWDARNENSSRATETLHAQVGHIPGVEVARFPLDALHVRLSRESAPGVPMH